MNGDPEKFYTDMPSQTHYGKITPLYSATTLEAQARENAELRNDLEAHRNQSDMREASKAQSEEWLEQARAERDAALVEVAEKEAQRLEYQRACGRHREAAQIANETVEDLRLQLTATQVRLEEAKAKIAGMMIELRGVPASKSSQGVSIFDLHKSQQEAKP